MQPREQIYNFMEVGVHAWRLTSRQQINAEVSYGEYAILNAVHRLCDKKESKVTPTELSTYLMVTKPAISKMLNLLEDKGLVNRSLDKADRRAVYVQLTDLGDKTLADAREPVMLTFEKALDGLGEEKSAQLLDLFQEFYKELVKESP